MKLDFPDRFSKSTHLSNFKKICPLGAELFHADTLGEANGRFLQFCDCARKKKTIVLDRGSDPGAWFCFPLIQARKPN